MVRCALSTLNVPPLSFKRREQNSEEKWAWLFIAPCLCGLLIFTYLPTLASFLLSFCYWDLLGIPSWVGTANYERIVSDPNFWKVLSNTLGFVSAITLLEIPLALVLAVWVHGLIRSQGLFRAVYFFPYITPMVSVAMVFGWFYEPQNGLVNTALFQLGLLKEPIAWLQTPQTAMASVVVLEIWKTLGYNMLLFLSGLQSIPATLNEAGTLDGASSTQQFWGITLPLLTPTVFLVLLVTLIHGFQAFDAIYLLTQGGPEKSTSVLVYWVYKNAFEYFRVGPASACAYLLFLIILALTGFQWWLRKQWVLHETED